MKILLQQRQLKPDEDLFIAMMQRDTYSLKEIDRVSNSLGHKPGRKAWGYIIKNAVRAGDEENAEMLFSRALWRKVVPDFSGADALIRLLLHPHGRSYSDKERTLKAVDVFRRWAEHGLGFDGCKTSNLHSLLRALLAQPSIENRQEHIDFILDYVKRHGYLLEPNSPRVSAVLDSVYRSAKSHAEAVDLVKGTTTLSGAEVRALFGYIAGMRFDAATIMPAATVRAFLKYAAVKHDVGVRWYTAFLRSIHDSFAPELLTLQALNTVRAVAPPAGVRLDAPYYTMCLQLFGRFARAGIRVKRDLDECWRQITARGTADAIAVRAMLQAFPAWRAAQLYEAWAPAADAATRHSVLSEWAQVLCRLDRRRAFNLLLRGEGDKPGSPALAMFFATASTELDKEKCKQHFPTAWEDPATQAAVARLLLEPSMAQYRPVEAPVKKDTEALEDEDDSEDEFDEDDSEDSGHDGDVIHS
ncbi:hypothetical protein AURDEDRAFT_116700 [Auricularia subglabra TFB-10046 SS5]|uniref:Uncharacterized protein n=1 Tax=Auricularia subglabra (strain TFB-10046 / SS5) TaxID=717982 RepID=J0D0C7_AURST|nr:hypothetical protein AURDEDRAFT_116700 [Auricularia subglabra TFB-10046 SS5]